MNWLYFSIAAIIIFVFGALFAAPYVINWNDHRSLLEAQLAHVLGRDVKVAGDVEVQFLPSPYVRFADVTVGGDAANPDLPILKTKSFTMWLAVSPLVRGTFEARDMEIDSAVVNVRVGADGKTNWSGVSESGAKLSWMPADVALDSVRIINSAISFVPGEGLPEVNIDGLSGTLSMRSLKGPFKFSGTWGAEIDGQEDSAALTEGEERRKVRDVRLSTGVIEADGAMRIRSIIRALDSGARFNIDGKAIFSTEAPKFEGVLTAQLPPLLEMLSLPNRGGGDVAPVAGEQTASENVVRNGTVEVKTAMDVSDRRALFNNVVMTYENNSRPQLINGEAIIDWGRGVSVTGQVSAKLLDLDHLLSGNQGVAEPRQVLALFRNLLRDEMGVVNRATLRADVEQTSLGGELVQSVDMTLIKSEGRIEISSLSAQLPGRNSLTLSGELLPVADKMGFEGPFSLSGENLPKLLRWVGVLSGEAGRQRIARYQVKGKALYGPERLAISDVKGEIAGATIAGGLRYVGGEKQSLFLKLDSDKLDVATLLGEQGSLSNIRSLLSGASSDDVGMFGLPRGVDASFDVRLGQANFTNFDAQDVVVNARVSDDEILINEVNISGAGGLGVKASGTVDQSTDRLSGSLALALKAQESSALQSLVDLLGLPQSKIDLLLGEDRMRSLHLVPLDIAVNVDPVKKSGTGALVRIHGAAGDNSVSVKVQTQSGLKDLLSQKIVLTGNAVSKDARNIIAFLFERPLGKLDSFTGEDGKAQPGTYSISAVGVPNANLKIESALRAADVVATYKGSGRYEDRLSSLSGKVEVSADKAEGLVSAFGFSSVPGDVSKGFKFVSDLKQEEAVYSLSNIEGQWGQDRFRGQVSIDGRADVTLVDAEIGISGASLPSLLGVLVEQPVGLGLENVVAAQDAVGTSYWPSRSFAKDWLGRYRGRVGLAIGNLSVSDKIIVKDAAIIGALDDGRLEMTLAQGKLFGGSVQSQVVVEAVTGGLDMTGRAALQGAELKVLSAVNTGTALGQGPVGVSLEFAGQGLSPRGLVSVLSGKGELTVGKGQIYKFSPKALPGLLAVSTKKDLSGKVQADLARRLKKGSLGFSAKKVPLEISNGAVRAGVVSVSGGGTDIKIRSSLELADLTLKSGWTLSAKRKGSKEDVPSARISFAGSLEEFGSMKPKFETQVLERFFTVEKMERDVNKLEDLERQERLRVEAARKRRLAEEKRRLEAERKRLAEERRRQEAERLRQEEEERRRAVIERQRMLDSQRLLQLELDAQRGINSNNAPPSSGGVPDVQSAPLDSAPLPPPASGSSSLPGPANGSGAGAVGQEGVAVPLPAQQPPAIIPPTPKKPQYSDNPLNPFGG